jgi:hypothetical protein
MQIKISNTNNADERFEILTKPPEDELLQRSGEQRGTPATLHVQSGRTSPSAEALASVMEKADPPTGPKGRGGNGHGGQGD